MSQGNIHTYTYIHTYTSIHTHIHKYKFWSTHWDSRVTATSYSMVLYLTRSIALPRARDFQKHSRPQAVILCRSLHAKTL